MFDPFIKLLDAALDFIERLLIIINSTKRLLFFSTFVLLAGLLWAFHQISLKEDIISEFAYPKIERVDTCYQQRVRLNRRIIAVQYPIPDSLVNQGAVQILSAVVVKDYPDIQRFNSLCQGLIAEIAKPENDVRWFQFDPQLKKKIQDFYRNLDTPAPQILKESDIKRK